MNKQLFEEMVQKVIVVAKEAMGQKQVGQKQPGGDTSGDRPVLDSQISSESITIGAVAQQVQNVHDINFYRVFFLCSSFVIVITVQRRVPSLHLYKTKRSLVSV